MTKSSGAQTAPVSASAEQPQTAAASIPAGDEIVTGRGDLDGYHLFAATAVGGWRWRSLATLRPGGSDEQRWIGQQCSTGDGRYVVAVVAPWSSTNIPGGLDRGGVAYAVDAHTGKARALTSGVALYYHTPGCGADSHVVLTRYLGVDQLRTELLDLDAATGGVEADQIVSGQVTSAVPGAGRMFAARGSALVQLRTGGERTLARLSGPVTELRPNAMGGVDFLTTDVAKSSVRVWRLGATGTPVQLASGQMTKVHLFQGKAGYNSASGISGSVTGGLRALPVSRTQTVAASLDGAVAAAEGTAPVTVGYRGQLGNVPLVVGRGGARLTGAIPAPTAPIVSQLPLSVGSGVGHPALSASRVAANASSSAPTCSVARNNPAIQVPQPESAQVQWAVNHLVQSDVALTRSANFDNLGLPAYTAGEGLDYPAKALTGGGNVPRELVEAILAQESNWDQASPHALPGVAGNPYIADYYGYAYSGDPGGNPPDYDHADCGYGIGQITDGMRFASGSTTPTALQEKVAVDYAENIAAAISILTDKWNALYTAGITANSGSASVLEDWYFAAWAYNTGIDPQASTGNTSNCTPGPGCTDGAGNWGLGWTNNPQNPNWQVGRAPFLDTSSADASTPQYWPYQEKVFGWMNHPQLDINGSLEYQAPSGVVALPAASAFCDNSDNCNTTDSPGCDQNGLNCTNPGAFCGYSGSTTLPYHCWWHESSTWCTPNCTSTTSESVPIAEPSAANPYPPECELSSAVPSNAIVVAEESQNWNLAGCTPTTWANRGTFTTSFGSGGTGTDWDFHQLGVGFGGHMYFTHTETVGDNQAVTATWAPNSLTTGAYQIYAYVPDNGASAAAYYRINDGVGTVYTPDEVEDATGARAPYPLDQSVYSSWVSIGTYYLHSGASVQLSNVNANSTPGVDLAFGAIAFAPVSTTAPKCTGHGCAGLDPTTEGCDGPGTITAQSLALSNAALDLRVSPQCQTVWFQSLNDPAKGTSVTARLLSSQATGWAPIWSSANELNATQAFASTMDDLNRYVWLCANPGGVCGNYEHIESSGRIDTGTVWQPICTDTTCEDFFPFGDPQETGSFAGSYYTGCLNDAVVEAQATDTAASARTVRLMYSPSCHAAWAQGASPNATTSNDPITVQGTTLSPATDTDWEANNPDSTGVYTYMIGTETYSVRACIRPAGYADDPSTWPCTAWYKLN